jgi:hypothetical protein
MKPVSVGVLCLLFFCVDAHAQAQPGESQADALFRQGKTLMAQGKLTEACAAFDESQKLAPAISTLLNQANCREKNGQLATAATHFKDAERQTQTATDDAGKQLHRVAADRLVALAPRLSTLTIQVTQDRRVQGLELLRDGAVVDPLLWGSAIPVDGGTVTIVARAPGYTEWKTSVTIEPERDAKRVEVPRLEPTPAQTTTSQPAHANEDQQAEHDEHEQQSRPHGGSKTVPLIFTGAALASAAAAVGFELWGRSIYADAKAEPDNALQESKWKDANTRHYAAQGFGVAAVACAGVAIWTFVRSRDEGSPTVSARGVHVQPVAVVGRGEASVQLMGRF